MKQLKAWAYIKLLEWRLKLLTEELEKLRLKYETTDRLTLPDNYPVSQYKAGQVVHRPSGDFKITGVDGSTNSLMLEKISKENLYSADK